MSTKAKPTPGPWEVQEIPHADGSLHLQIGHEGRGPIAELKYLVTDQDEQRANARLLASAPELRDHLRSMCALAYSVMNPGALPPWYWTAVELLDRIDGRK